MKVNLLIRLTSFSNGFSQVYILMTWIPPIISDINRTLSSVLIAIFNLNFDIHFPIYPKVKTDLLISFLCSLQKYAKLL